MEDHPERLDKPLKIALICDWFLPKVGGIELHVRDLALHLAGLGHTVHVLTPVPGPAEVDAIPVWRLAAPLHRFVRLAWHPATFRRITEIIRAQRYDLVHCHASYIAPFAYGAVRAAQRLGVPTVVTFHSLLGRFACGLACLERLFGRKGAPALLSAVSPVVADGLRPLAGERPVHLLPNGVDPVFWKVDPAARSDGEVRLVSVFRMSPRKRGKALLGIAAAVRRRLPAGVKLRLVVIGDGLQRHALERLAGRLSLEGVVTFAGYRSREQIRGIFAAADIFVLPTVLESFGIAALEARCAGLPVVARAGNGVGEFIRDGQEGLIARSDAEMAEQLLRLIVEGPLRLAIAQHNRQTPPPYAWEAVLAAHLALYRQALQSAAGGPSVQNLSLSPRE
jgi:glycosyltransferase involved in cell wall biosynthesis